MGWLPQQQDGIWGVCAFLVLVGERKLLALCLVSMYAFHQGDVMQICCFQSVPEIK